MPSTCANRRRASLISRPSGPSDRRNCPSFIRRERGASRHLVPSAQRSGPRIEEAGATRAPRAAVTKSNLPTLPSRAAWSPAGRRTQGHAAKQHLAKGSRPWMDPLGLRRALSLRDFPHGAAHSSRKVPVAFRSLVKSGEMECKGGFRGGDKYFLRQRGAERLARTRCG